jgi:hypothetical protein
VRLLQLLDDELGPPSYSCGIELVIVKFLSYSTMDCCNLRSLRALNQSKWMHGIRTTQWDMETEGKGQAWIMLGRTLTESLHRRSSRTDLQAVSSVEDVQVTLPQPLFPVNCETQADYKEDTGHPKTKDRACRSASWRGREAVCNWWFVTPHYVFLTPPTGQVNWRWPPALEVRWSDLQCLLAVGGDCQDRAHA